VWRGVVEEMMAAARAALVAHSGRKDFITKGETQNLEP